MKLLALFSALLLTFSSFAQNRGTGQNRGGQQMTGHFYGRIVDASGKSVPAASVVLVQSKMDSATQQRKDVVVGGMLTASNGDFSIENVPVFGQYKLRVTGIGYKKYEQPVQFERPKAGGGDPSSMLSALDKDLGNIKLGVDEQTLSTVTVTSTKPQMQLGIDRKIFNVEKNITSTGGTAIDVMRNVPSVSVDVDGNVTLRNNAPQIFVDGRPTNLTLDQIPADAIESVEIITNPSAKFDASGGTAGILNIVLKKQKRIGYAGSIRANVDSRGRVGGGGDINVRQGKVNFFASAQVNQRKSVSKSTTDQRITDTAVTVNHQQDNSTMNGLFGFGRAGVDYFINNRNTITVSGSMARGKMEPSTNSDITVDSISSGGLKSYYNPRYNSSTNRFRNYGSQVSFKHNFPKSGHEWTADVTYNSGTFTSESNIRTEQNKTYPTQLHIASFTQNQVISTSNDNMIAQTDYANPLSDKSKIEAGARVSIRNINSNTVYDIANPSKSVYYTNQDRVYAGYATFSSKIKNFGYQLGLRAESSQNEGKLQDKQSFTTQFPISLFPSIFLSQKLNESNDLQLNYSRRINRPNFMQMFPYVDSTDLLNISKGNPALKPEFTNSLELSYSHTFKNRDNFLASAYFKNTNDLITRYQYREFDSIHGRPLLYNTYINANRSYVTGLELISRNKITNWWDLTSNFNLFTAKIEVVGQASQNPFTSYFIKINNAFKLPKNFSFQLSGDYTSKIIAGPGGSGGGGGGGGRGGGMGGGMFGGGGSNTAAQGYIRPNYSVDAAVRYDFMKNKVASLSLNVNDIFRTRKYDAHTEQPGFVQDIVRYRDPQIFRLNFNYRFGKMDASLFKRKNTKAENDVQTEGVM